MIIWGVRPSEKREYCVDLTIERILAIFAQIPLKLLLAAVSDPSVRATAETTTTSRQQTDWSGFIANNPDPYRSSKFLYTRHLLHATLFYFPLHKVKEYQQLATEEMPNIPFEMIRADPILREIGNTPLIPHPENEQIFLKNERQNPTLSHKDRLGAGMILGLREMGELEEDQRVVEASSGNTAGAVALAANRLNHPCTIVMQESTSPVKQGFAKSLGAEVITTPTVGHGKQGYYQKVAKRYAENNNAVYVNQYERPLNRLVHYQWTGPELYDQIRNEDFTHVIGAVSTCGLLSGIAEYLKEVESQIKIIGVDGVNSNIHRTFHGKKLGDYDVGVEGLGQWRVTETANLSALDDVKMVSDSIAISRAKFEAKNNALLMGLSSGGAMEIAQQISRDEGDSKIVSIIHDGAEQYFHEVDGW